MGTSQYVWAFGVFSWGLGMFLFFTVARYLEWKLLADRFSFLNLRGAIVTLLISLVMGCLFGAFTAPRLSDRTLDVNYARPRQNAQQLRRARTATSRTS
jgi:uncharacterized protein YneF (UPF0154 family)